jgi:hypothetical protein
LKRLGYTRYVAQGGDWGAIVVDQMGLQASPGLLAIHTNMPATVPADVNNALLAGSPAAPGLSVNEQLAYEQLVRTFKKFNTLRLWDHARKPYMVLQILQSVSPHGFSTTMMLMPAGGGDCLGPEPDDEHHWQTTRDEILDNITLYWLTNTGVSAARLYGNIRMAISMPRASPFRWP